MYVSQVNEVNFLGEVQHIVETITFVSNSLLHQLAWVIKFSVLQTVVSYTSIIVGACIFSTLSPFIQSTVKFKLNIPTVESVNSMIYLYLTL